VGVSTRESNHLNFLYECSDQFSVIPTYWTIPSVKTVFESTIIQDALIANNIRGDPVKVCHNLIDFWLSFYKTQSISDFVFEGFIWKIWLLFIDLIVVKLHWIWLRFWEIFLNWTLYLFKGSTRRALFGNNEFDSFVRDSVFGTKDYWCVR
jgi:hypothetical protein